MDHFQRVLASSYCACRHPTGTFLVFALAYLLYDVLQIVYFEGRKEERKNNGIVQID